MKDLNIYLIVKHVNFGWDYETRMHFKDALQN